MLGQKLKIFFPTSIAYKCTALQITHDLVERTTLNNNITLQRPTSISLFSYDYELLKCVAANLKAFKKPDSYKGKGFSYSTELLTLKEIKKN